MMSSDISTRRLRYCNLHGIPDGSVGKKRHSCNLLVLVANTAIFRSEFVTSNPHTLLIKLAVLIAHQ